MHIVVFSFPLMPMPNKPCSLGEFLFLGKSKTGHVLVKIGAIVILDSEVADLMGNHPSPAPDTLDVGPLRLRGPYGGQSDAAP